MRRTQSVASHFCVARLLLALLLGCAGPTQLSAEQFHLVDGRKIDGRIISFERNGFKVETETGVVVIYRDQIRRIVFYSVTGPQTLEPGQTPVRGSTRSTTRAGVPAPEVAGRAGPVAAPRVPADVPRPVPPPKPERMIEQVSATSYTNESFGFRFYKPPGWRSFPGLVKTDNPLLAALGTPDEKTLLLVGQEIYQGDLVTYTQLAEDSLRELYPDYYKREERFTRFAGFPALERHFTGSAEGQYWSGLAIYFAHGDSYYTFLGVTAEGDTLDFQQSLLRKIVNTVEFGQRR